jgi:hypothetical protein
MLDSPSNKRLRLSSSSEPDEGADSVRTLTNPQGAAIPEPDMPVNAHFWAMLEWWLDCRRIEYGSDMNTPPWKA